MGALADLRVLNRQRILDALRHHGSGSRSDLIRLTGLSRTTVVSVVSDLLSDGLMFQDDDAGPRAPLAGRGRPPTIFRLSSAAGAVVGVNFGRTHVRVAIADLTRTVLAERVARLDVDHTAVSALDAAADLVDQVVRDTGILRNHIVGAGMGLPAPVDRRSGSVASLAILPNWVGLKAADELARRVQLPVAVDNAVNLGCLAEATMGAGRGLSSLVLVKIGAGVGAGMVLDGHMYRGATGLAGELGHVQVLLDGALCRCGNRGCLESSTSVGALLALLRPVHGQDLTMHGMLDLLAAGDRGVHRVFKDAGRTLGRVLAHMCNFLNPQAIIVGGDIGASGQPLLDGIRESIDRFALPAAAEVVDVIAGELGERAEVLGALTVAIGHSEPPKAAGLTLLSDRRLQVYGSTAMT